MTANKRSNALQKHGQLTLVFSALSILMFFITIRTFLLVGYVENMMLIIVTGLTLFTAVYHFLQMRKKRQAFATNPR
ncbi:hypothetical protein EQV77_02480 [Halobacillus fulvus]|nr:hypothetical protein EQV77_02480 [Halobacillus fulvus]